MVLTLEIDIERQGRMSKRLDQPSLFEQLGGSDQIEAMIAQFYDRIFSDESLRPMFANVDMDQLRRHQTLFISYAMGGPNEYRGRSMREAHKGLGITEDQLMSLIGHLVDTMVSFNVPAELNDLVTSQLVQLKDQIVER
jgi:hemoglobin